MKNYDVSKAKSGNLGKGIYVTTSEETLISKAKDLGNYGAKKYKNINRASSNGTFKEFSNFKDYRKELKLAGFSDLPKDKEAYNKYLESKGFDGIKVDTVGHKDQLMLFNTSTIN